MTMRVSIIGSGVAGLATAFELVSRGAVVTVFEQSATVAEHACSRYAGGMLAPWCERESAEEDVVTLGEMSADWWENATGGVERNGTLVVAQGRDRSELMRFGARTRNFETIRSEEIAKLEPDLAGRFQHGLFFGSEGHLDPRKTISVLYDRLIATGVRFEFGKKVQPQELDGLVIDARGFAAADRLADLRGVKGEMLLVRCPDIELNRPVRMLHPRIPLYVVPRADDIFMIGATMIESADRKRITARSMLELLGSAYALHPAFGEAEIVETGVDVRPAFPDNLPRVERSANIISINGLYRHGFLLSPAIARKAADLIMGTVSEPSEEKRHAHQA